jgi:hypothetical protein
LTPEESKDQSAEHHASDTDADLCEVSKRLEQLAG